jgi:hypothetical protein
MRRSDAPGVSWLFVLPASFLPLFRGWQADFSYKNKRIARIFSCLVAISKGIRVSGWQANFPTKTSGSYLFFLPACHLPG